MNDLAQSFLLLRVGSSGFPYMADKEPSRAIAADAQMFMEQYNVRTASLHHASRDGHGTLSWGPAFQTYEAH